MNKKRQQESKNGGLVPLSNSRIAVFKGKGPSAFAPMPSPLRPCVSLAQGTVYE